MNTQQILFMIFAFIVSFAFTFATTPLVRRLAFRIGQGAVDIPRDARRMHKKPTPRIGGLAIIFGFIVATLCFAQPSRQLFGTQHDRRDARSRVSDKGSHSRLRRLHCTKKSLATKW